MNKVTLIWMAQFILSSATSHAQSHSHEPNKKPLEPSGPSILEVFDPLQGDFSRYKEVTEPQVMDLTQVEVFELKATMVKQAIAGKIFKRFAYNGSIPGPLFKVKQGKTAKIRFTNDTDVDTSIHSHGLRHSWKMDGQVPTSQAAVKPGESFLYELQFPDAGLFWYHPHLREDYQQDMGLVGNFWVEPQTDTHWNAVTREETLMLDDVLAKAPVPYPIHHASHALMGRFGDTMLVNGKEPHKGPFTPGQVVRYFITNAANTRTFRIQFKGAQMKLVGSDLSRLETEIHVDAVTIAPGERYIVEVKFPKSGLVKLENATPMGSALLMEFQSNGKKSVSIFKADFKQLRKNKDVTRELKRALEQSQKELPLSLTLDLKQVNKHGKESSLMDHHAMDHSHHFHSTVAPTPKIRDVPWLPHPSKVEWEDTMSSVNSKSNSSTLSWMMIDQSKKENMNVNWNLKKGASYRISIKNPKSGTHPMQHPIHFHGQRFFVDQVNGKKVKNRAWKDTVLVGQGDTVELILEASNPGKWMAHCHIAEHLTSGMMTGFEVQN